MDLRYVWVGRAVDTASQSSPSHSIDREQQSDSYDAKRERKEWLGFNWLSGCN